MGGLRRRVWSPPDGHVPPRRSYQTMRIEAASIQVAGRGQAALAGFVSRLADSMNAACTNCERQHLHSMGRCLSLPVRLNWLLWPRARAGRTAIIMVCLERVHTLAYCTAMLADVSLFGCSVRAKHHKYSLHRSLRSMASTGDSRLAKDSSNGFETWSSVHLPEVSLMDTYR